MIPATRLHGKTSGTGRCAYSILGLVACCPLLFTVAGCVSQGVADQVNQRLNYGMTTSELKIANRVAIDQTRKEDATVMTATATVGDSASAGTATSPSPHPRPCTSGRLLYITLAGQFPHAGQAGSTPVSGQRLTVDAATGRVCEAHYLSGPILGDPESARLFSN